MKKAALYFHQGWTDIINSLALVNYYSERFDHLTLVMRHDAHPIVTYYVQQFNNVTVDYYSKADLDINLSGVAANYSDMTLLFLGVHDAVRNDGSKNIFRTTKPDTFFVAKFYLCYGVDYMTRISYFNLARARELEDQVFENFTANHGKDYVLYHEDIERGIMLNKNGFKRGAAWVDLDKKSYIFFDYIKVMENASEMHLLDSVWAAVVYQIDARFGLFRNIPITVHCLRGYREIFLEPVQLPNWSIL